MESDLDNEALTGEAPRARVLVVDDTKVMRRSAEKMLGDEFDVVVAENGEEGWKALCADESIQVVFSDWNMPILDGRGLLERIRAAEDEGIRDIPVIVVTGDEDDTRVKNEALEAGCTDFITKPFNSMELRARARAHANYHRKTRESAGQPGQDQATGTLNRAALLLQLGRDLAFVQRHGQPMALACFEVLEFDQLFMRLGRSSSDALMRHVARLLERAVRREDCVARIKPGCFAVILTGAKSSHVRSLAERICEAVAAVRAKLRGEPIQLKLAAGVHMPDGMHEAPEEVLAAAERALDVALRHRGQEVVLTTDGDEGLGVGGLDGYLVTLEANETALAKERWPAAQERLKQLFQRLDSEQRAQLRTLLND